MEAISTFIRILVVANLAAIVGVFFFGSRPLALKVLMVFRASALALLLLVPMEYMLRREKGESRTGLILDVVLAAAIFVVWFAINAATF